MKNLYDVLGVSKDMTCEEIEATFDGKINTLGIKEQRALDVLTDAKKRQAYDNIEIQACDNAVNEFYHNEKQYELEQLFSAGEENTMDLEVASETEVIEVKKSLGLTDEEVDCIKTASGTVVVPKANKEKFYKTLGGRIAIVATAAVVLVGVCFLIKPKGNSKNPVNNQTNVTATPTPGLKPEQQPEVTPTPEVQLEQEPEVEEVVINPEEVTEINSENIDVMANYFTEQAASKGLEVNPEEVRSALIIANKDSISKEELEAMVPGLDLVSEYNKANNYSCAVNSHNIANCLYGKDMTKYVSVSNLCYSNDSHIVQSLEAYNVYLTECMNRGYLTEDEYNTTFRLITRFYEEKSGLVVGDFEYNYEDLTAGGKYFAEVAIWPNFSVAFTISDYATEDTLADIKSMERVTIDGAKYLNELTNCGNVKTR